MAGWILESDWRVKVKLRFGPGILAGGGIVVFFLLLAIIGPMVTPYSPFTQDVSSARKGPCSDHWLGTDELGRDLLSRIIAGARISLKACFLTLILSSTTGTVIGLILGYAGGITDLVVMRLIDTQEAIPGIALALILVGAVGSGLGPLIFVMGILSYPSFARLSRSLTLRFKQEAFIEAAIAIGASPWRVIRKHLLPNVTPHILSLASINLGRTVLGISSLGFLGFGLEPGTPEWGMMIAQGRDLFRTYPHIILFPGAVIALLVFGFNLLGDGLRDMLDPRLKGTRI